jgi:methionyl-tRNA synthetase
VRNNTAGLVVTWGSPGGDGQRPRRALGFMLAFAHKRFDGCVPEPGDLDHEERALLAKFEAGFEIVGELPQERLPVSGCAERSIGPAKAATPPARVAREANGYLERKAPWFQIKEDRQSAATSVYVTQSVRIVDNLKTLLAPTPCVPHTAQKLHEYLGYDGQLFGTRQVVEYQEEARHGGVRSHEALTYDHTGAIGTWAVSELPPGHPPGGCVARRFGSRHRSSRSWMRA